MLPELQWVRQQAPQRYLGMPAVPEAVFCVLWLVSGGIVRIAIKYRQIVSGDPGPPEWANNIYNESPGTVGVNECNACLQQLRIFQVSRVGIFGCSSQRKGTLKKGAKPPVSLAPSQC